LTREGIDEAEEAIGAEGLWTTGLNEITLPDLLTDTPIVPNADGVACTTGKALAWIIHENIHRIGLVADGGLAGSQSPLWAPKSALRPLQPVYRGGLFSQMRSI